MVKYTQSIPRNPRAQPIGNPPWWCNPFPVELNIAYILETYRQLTKSYPKP